MREVSGDLWWYHNRGEWIVVTTNGFVKNNGEAVMGRGCARQAARRFPELLKRLGSKLKEYGNHVHAFEDLRIITFPTKHVWYEKSDPDLIVSSAKELHKLTRRLGLRRVYLPRPGCSNGKLNWKDVKPLISWLPDKFVVVQWPRS
jgi:hypothetical protein